MTLDVKWLPCEGYSTKIIKGWKHSEEDKTCLMTLIQMMKRENSFSTIKIKVKFSKMVLRIWETSIFWMILTTKRILKQALTNLKREINSLSLIIPLLFLFLMNKHMDKIRAATPHHEIYQYDLDSFIDLKECLYDITILLKSARK